MVNDADSSHQFVDVTDDPTWSKTYDLAKRRVHLPIKTSLVRGWLVFSLTIFLAGIFLSLLPYWLITREPEISWSYLGRVGFSVLFALPALKCVGIALTAIFDRFRGSAVVEIDHSGIIDRRISSQKIEFASVESAAVLVAGIGFVGFIFKLKQPVQLKRNPFRWGGSWRNTFSDGRDLKISLYWVDANHEQRKAVVELLKREGVAVVHAGTWSSSLV
jgi:hypothetical protein